MQLIAKLTHNAVFRRLATAGTVAVLALTLLAVGQSLTRTAADHGLSAGDGRGTKVMATVTGGYCRVCSGTKAKG